MLSSSYWKKKRLSQNLQNTTTVFITSFQSWIIWAGPSKKIIWVGKYTVRFISNSNHMLDVQNSLYTLVSCGFEVRSYFNKNGYCQGLRKHPSGFPLHRVLWNKVNLSIENSSFFPAKKKLKLLLFRGIEGRQNHSWYVDRVTRVWSCGFLLSCKFVALAAGKIQAACSSLKDELTQKCN